MAIYKRGDPAGGPPLGILMLNTKFPRVPGDVGNKATFDFPVRYKVVPEADSRRVVKEGDPGLLEPFIAAARELEREGCGAITTSCGFLVMFQRELAAAVNVPVLTSSLLQVPLAAAMLGPRRQVGILTISREALGEKHFRGAGMEGCDYVIRGMDDSREFREVFLENREVLDFGRAEMEITAAAKDLTAENPAVGAIVLECANMPPFARAIQEAVNLPVYDITTLIRFALGGFFREIFPPPALP